MNEQELRRSYVGGPRAAAIMGLNPYETPVGAWLQLTGRGEPVNVTEIMRSGQRLERAVLDYAAEELGTEVMPGPFIRDTRLPIAGGHLDGVTGTPDIIEAKTQRSKAGWGEPGSSDMPAHIAAQALWYLGLLPEARICWVPVLFSGLDFAMYRVDRDEKLIAQMRNIVWRFWKDHVETDTPPPPTTGADASLLFPRDAGKVVIADDAVAAAVSRLHAVRHSLDTLKTEEDELVGRVKLAMADAAVLTINGETACTWKAAKSTMRFDSTAFKTAQPETYNQFCRPIESRRFLLKQEK